MEECRREEDASLTTPRKGPHDFYQDVGPVSVNVEAVVCGRLSNPRHPVGDSQTKRSAGEVAPARCNYHPSEIIPLNQWKTVDSPEILSLVHQMQEEMKRINNGESSAFQSMWGKNPIECAAERQPLYNYHRNVRK